MDFDLLDLFGGTAMGTSLFGAPGASQLFGDMSVPGMPLLKAGGDDPAPILGGGQLVPGLTRGGMEGAPPGVQQTLNLGPSRGLLDAPAAYMSGTGGAGTGGTPIIKPPVPGTPNPPPIILPGPAAGEEVHPLPVAPGAGGLRPVESRSGTPPGGAAPPIKIGAATAGGGTVPGQAAPPAAVPPAGAPAAAPDPNAPQGTALDRLNAAMAKVPAIGAGKALTPANIGSAGQPHIPQGGAALFQALLEQHAKEMPRPGGVPGLPDALKRRTQGGVF